MDQLRAEHRTEPRRIQGDQNDGRNYGYGLNGDETDEGSGKAKDNHVKKQTPRAANNMIAVAGLALAAS